MLGCFSRLRRPAAAAGSPPAPMAHSDEAPSTSTDTSPCSSSSSIRCSKINSGGVGVDAKNASALSDSGLSSAIASRRFFVSSPGRTNSIVEDSSAAARVVTVGVGAGAGGVAVATYSPDPHGDFLRSMEEMVTALRLDARRRGDRARLHELLLCYLALNDRRAHKFVVSAFTDLLLRLTAAAAAADDDSH